MGLEIERKYLVRHDLWHPAPGDGVPYRQGYLAFGAACVVRVRTMGDKAALTIKGATKGITRAEFEYPIPVADAIELLDTMCGDATVEKRRYRVPFEGHVWEVDVFEGENAGLITAEVELPSADAEVIVPPWIDHEVTGDSRYANSALARRPFRSWTRHP